MQPPSTVTIVGIRFQRTGKIYHFDAGSVPDLQVGDFAIVETTRGRQMGEVVHFIPDPPPPPDGAWKPIHHKASARDLVMRQLWQKKELEAMINCRAKLAELGPAGVKIVAAEFSFDGTRLAFLFSTESEGKVELRSLRNAMQKVYPRSQVEMRQIGPRDVAKYLGGMGACGIESRCCTRFLTDFSPISIKMAKEQGISLTPTEITGMCGRLRCCLVYEYEQYVEARKVMPKRGKRVVTARGEAKVLDVQIFKQTVTVEFDDGTQAEFANYEIEPWDELEALRRKSLAPCGRHENGQCDCGKEAPEAPAATMFDDFDADEPEPAPPPPPARPVPPAARQQHQHSHPHQHTRPPAKDGPGAPPPPPGRPPLPSAPGKKKNKKKK